MSTLVKRVLALGGSSREAMGDRCEQALYSLRARSIIDMFQRDSPGQLRMQWSRGHYGQRLECRRRGRKWDLAVIPISNPAGPFGSGAGSDITPLGSWDDCGDAIIFPGVNRLSHVDLVEELCGLEIHHPVPGWLAQQCDALASGRLLDNDTLQAMNCLGARRFFRTLPNADRLQKAIEPVLLTLLRASIPKVQADPGDHAELNVSIGENPARVLAEALQESHPLEARRAAQRYAMAMSA